MEAEYVPYSVAAQEVMWFMSCLPDLDLSPRVHDPVEKLRDNTATTCFVKDSRFHWNIKHIRHCYHFVQEAINTKQITIKYIPTNNMIVDLLTKPIRGNAFKAHTLSVDSIGFSVWIYLVMRQTRL